jgi:hypothetical protein
MYVLLYGSGKASTVTMRECNMQCSNIAKISIALFSVFLSLLLIYLHDIDNK